MEAANYTAAKNAGGISWKAIPNIGRTGDGITTFPVTASISLSATSPHLRYEFYSYDTGKVNLNLYFSPTLNFHNKNEGLQYAVSIDDEQPQIFSLNKNDNDQREWNSWVANNIIHKKSAHGVRGAGKHVVKYWMISPAVILQKLVVDYGGLKPSYLGPEETRRK